MMEEAASVLEFWRKFNFDAQRITLDKQCLEMREAKVQSVAGRKSLNELTKSFRAKNKEEQLLMTTELLKAYQDEIDRLSRRAKFCEHSFHGLYKDIYEAPDPSKILETTLKHLSVSSTYVLEIERLKLELSDYDEEFRQLKNQDITIRRLEDQIAEFKDSIEEKVSQEVDARMEEMEEKANERIQDAKDVQRAAEKRLAAAVQSMNVAQQTVEQLQTELYDLSADREKHVASVSQDKANVADSLERANQRIHDLEWELSSSSQQKNFDTPMSDASVPSSRDISPSPSNAKLGLPHELEAEVKYLQQTNMSLQEQLLQHESITQQVASRHGEAMQEVIKSLTVAEESNSEMRLELSSRPQTHVVTSLQAQLKVLQEIVFHSTEDDDGTSGDVPTSDELGTPLALEKMLSKRVKEQEKDLVALRCTVSDLKMTENRLQESVISLSRTCASKSELVVRLEADLEHQINNAVPKAHKGRFEDVSTPQSSSKTPRQKLMTPSQQMSETAAAGLSELLGVDGDDGVSVPGADQDNGHSEHSNHINPQMVNMLQSQRDRFRERYQETLASLSSLQRVCDAVTQEKEQLEADNIALYAKVRYVQSYKQQQDGRSNYDSMESYSNSSKFSSRKSVYSDDVEEARGSDSSYNKSYNRPSNNAESKYQNLYEAKLNPFAEFSHQEKQRKLQELSVGDRLILSTTMTCVSSHTGRSVMLVYLASMHLLVFFTVYYVAHHHPEALVCPPCHHPLDVSALPTV